MTVFSRTLKETYFLEFSSRKDIFFAGEFCVLFWSENKKNYMLHDITLFASFLPVVN